MKVGTKSKDRSRTLANATGLKVKTAIKACGAWQNHNQGLARARKHSVTRRTDREDEG